MISPQPVFSLKYFSPVKKPVKNKVNRVFFMSFEDALWQVLRTFRLKKNAVVMIPEFYCSDVMKNLNTHGIKSRFYPVGNNLQTDVKDLIKILVKIRPDILVIFHADGITNTLLTEKTGWLKYILPDTIIIEDSVHRIVEPDKIKFLTEKHFVIDSLRKVLPVQGSFLYQKNPVIKPVSRLNLTTEMYKFRVIFRFLAMQFFLILKRYDLAEKNMLAGYDIIGDNYLPAGGLKLMRFLYEKINISAIKKIKARQVGIYDRIFANLPQSSPIKKLSFDPSDRRELRGYPLTVNTVHARKFINYLRSRGLYLRPELDDSPWTRKQKIIYLPLSPDLSTKELAAAAKIIYDYHNV